MIGVVEFTCIFFLGYISAAWLGIWDREYELNIYIKIVYFQICVLIFLTHMYRLMHP